MIRPTEILTFYAVDKGYSPELAAKALEPFFYNHSSPANAASEALAKGCCVACRNIPAIYTAVRAHGYGARGKDCGRIGPAFRCMT